MVKAKGIWHIEYCSLEMSRFGTVFNDHRALCAPVWKIVPLFSLLTLLKGLVARVQRCLDCFDVERMSDTRLNGCVHSNQMIYVSLDLQIFRPAMLVLNK